MIFKLNNEGKWEKFPVNLQLLNDIIAKCESKDAIKTKCRQVNVIRLTKKFRYFDEYAKRWKYPATKSMQSSYSFFDTKGLVNKDGGTVELRWSDTPPVRRNDEDVFNILSIFFSDGKAIYVKNPEEFLWFYLNPQREGSPHNTGQEVVFYIEDRQREAELKADSSELKTEALSMIYGKNKLSEKRLRDIAKGFNIAGINEMETFKEVQAALEPYATSNPQKFIDGTDSEDMRMKIVIRNAQDAKILGVKSGAWIFNNGGTEQKLVYMVGNEDPISRLLHFFKHQDKANVYSILENLVTEKEEMAITE